MAESTPNVLFSVATVDTSDPDDFVTANEGNVLIADDGLYSQADYFSDNVISDSQPIRLSAPTGVFIPLGSDITNLLITFRHQAGVFEPYPTTLKFQIDGGTVLTRTTSNSIREDSGPTKVSNWGVTDAEVIELANGQRDLLVWFEVPAFTNNHQCRIMSVYAQFFYNPPSNQEISGPDFFESAQNVDTAGSAWQDPENLLADAGVSTVTCPQLGGLTDRLELYHPLMDPYVKSYSTIDNIKITITGTGGDESGNQLRHVKISGATNEFQIGIDSLTPGPWSLDGDLTYWGIDNEQAMEFVRGSRALEVVGYGPNVFPAIGSTITLSKVEVEVVWTKGFNRYPVIF